MAVAADVFFGEPTRRLEVVGVTGTNGKSTTTFLLRAILEAAGRRHGLIGTVDWIVGGQRRDAPHTTPESIELQRLLAAMVEAGDEAVALEASSHGSHYRRLDRVRFDALVFTNLTQDHLDLHGDMEGYFQAKRRLFTGVDPPPAAVNVGDPYGRRLADELAGSARAPLVTFGLAARGRGAGRTGSSSARGARASARPGSSVETSLLGVFNVENVLGAVAGCAAARRRRRRDRGGHAGRRGRARPVRGDRRGPGLRGRRRLRPHAGCARQRPASRASARRRAADRRLRCGRRPRPGEAAADGAGRAPARGRRRRDERQPALGAAARDHRGDPPGGAARTSRSTRIDARRSPARSRRRARATSS